MKGFCINCLDEVVLDIVEREETYPVKGEPTTIKARNCVCAQCGKEVWLKEIDDENLRNAYAIYRSKHDLLEPKEILQIREKYGLSQVAFARVLGFGDKTIARYENGSIQDEAHNNLIMLMREAGNFVLLFNKNKHKLTKEEICRVESRWFTFMCPKTMKYKLQNASYDFADLNMRGMTDYFGIEERIG